ncbi:MAG: cysteine hydrolase family protein [Gammaproteobacteria bacterium]|nr:cysteine hydrolase family protein [Gammaproteobacteria bacterium]
MKTALLLISYQNDFFPNGRMALEKSLEAASRAQEALQLFRVNKLPIIHLQHMSTRPDDIHFLPCTRGVDFYPNLRPLKNETIIRKHYPNCFRDTTLKNFLKKNKIEHLILCGMMTHLSVDATVRAAYDLGFGCTVLQDACATKSLEFNGTTISSDTVQNAFLAALQPLYAEVITTRELLTRTSRRQSQPVAIPA